MGEEQMFLKLSKEIGECYRLAAEAREKASAHTDPVIRQAYLDMEQRWLTLAHRRAGACRALTDWTPRAGGGCPRSLAHLLSQGDGRAGPAFARGAVCGERNPVILDAGDVLDDACPVSGPGIDAEGAEGEVSSRCAHVRLFYPNPSRP